MSQEVTNPTVLDDLKDYPALQPSPPDHLQKEDTQPDAFALLAGMSAIMEMSTLLSVTLITPIFIADTELYRAIKIRTSIGFDGQTCLHPMIRMSRLVLYLSDSFMPIIGKKISHSSLIPSGDDFAS